MWWVHSLLIPLATYFPVTVICGVGYMKQQEVIAGPEFLQAVQSVVANGVSAGMRFMAYWLKSYLSVQREGKSEHCMCNYFTEVFNPKTKGGQPHTVSITTILGQGFCQVHPSTSAHYLEKPWSDDSICSDDCRCWLYWLFSDLVVWMSASDGVATTVCLGFSTEQPRSFWNYLILIRATYMPAGKPFSHKLLVVLNDDWIRFHTCSLVLFLTTSRSCLWFFWMGFFVYSRMPLSVLYESLTVREVVMKLKFYERIMRIQLMLATIHIPVVMFLVVCSKWELKMFLWGLGSAGNISWIGVTSMGIHFCMGKVDCE